mgnify:CR=1 FL=1
MKPLYLAAILMIAPTLSFADPPVIEQVSAERSDNGWRFDVTIRHADSGWEHYADAFRVLDMDGNELAMRPLAHPHTEEQPFTRSVSAVRIPEGTRQVQVQARDLPDGWNDDTTVVNLKN